MEEDEGIAQALKSVSILVNVITTGNFIKRWHMDENEMSQKELELQKECLKHLTICLKEYVSIYLTSDLIPTQTMGDLCDPMKNMSWEQRTEYIDKLTIILKTGKTKQEIITRANKACEETVQEI